MGILQNQVEITFDVRTSPDIIPVKYSYEPCGLPKTDEKPKLLVYFIITNYTKYNWKFHCSLAYMSIINKTAIAVMTIYVSIVHINN